MHIRTNRKKRNKRKPGTSGKTRPTPGRNLSPGMPSLRERLAILLLVCLLFPGMLLIGRDATAANGKEFFRIGFSAKTFANTNENDAIAALTVWLNTVTKELNIPTDPTPRIYKDFQSMKQDLIDKKIDALSFSTADYSKLRPLLDDHGFMVATDGKTYTTEYILLVHRDGNIQHLKDLKGVNLGLVNFGLASIWLDTVLMEAKFPPASEFCQIKEYSNVSHAVLPVFFRRTDACVVNRSGFQTMCELNPQLRQHLKILASSPGVVPHGLAFRRGYTSKIRDLLIDENGLDRLLTSTPGQQILTLFQISGFESRPVSCLKGSMEMVNRHKQLFDEYQGCRIKKQ